MTATYEPIETQTLGTAVADVYFTSIPQTYTDLVAVVQTRTTDAGAYGDLAVRCNSLNTNIYSRTYVVGNGTSAISGRNTAGSFGFLGGTTGASATAGVLAIYTINFMNYSNTSTFKTVLSRATNPVLQAEAAVTLIQTTNAISSINLLTASGSNFTVGSTFTLYGIKAE